MAWEAEHVSMDVLPATLIVIQGWVIGCKSRKIVFQSSHENRDQDGCQKQHREDTVHDREPVDL